jgi:hypothetical protein
LKQGKNFFDLLQMLKRCVDLPDQPVLWIRIVFVPPESASVIIICTDLDPDPDPFIIKQKKLETA